MRWKVYSRDGVGRHKHLHRMKNFAVQYGGAINICSEKKSEGDRVVGNYISYASSCFRKCDVSTRKMDRKYIFYSNQGMEWKIVFSKYHPHWVFNDWDMSDREIKIDKTKITGSFQKNSTIYALFPICNDSDSDRTHWSTRKMPLRMLRRRTHFRDELMVFEGKSSVTSVVCVADKLCVAAGLQVCLHCSVGFSSMPNAHE